MVPGGRDAEHRGRVSGLSPRIQTPHPSRTNVLFLLPQGEKEEDGEIEGRTDKVKGLVLRTEFLKKA